jgi:hypothetical protein
VSRWAVSKRPRREGNRPSCRRPFDRTELNVGAEVHITTDRRAAAEEAHRLHFYLSVDEILALPKFVAGTTDEIAEQLLGHRQRFGLSYFATVGVTPLDVAPVIDALRKEASRPPAHGRWGTGDTPRPVRRKLRAGVSKFHSSEPCRRATRLCR